MNFIVVGCCGKMGELVAKELIDKKQNVYGVDKNFKKSVLKCFDCIEKVCAKIDAIIDFSTANNREDYIEYARKNRIPYACFSTNISEKDLESFKMVSKEIPVLISANSSKGVGLLCDMVDVVSKALSECDITITEYHHKLKKDAPSGTAKKLQEIILNNNKCCQISSFRVGNEVGLHNVEFYFGDEVIQISHRANSKKVFSKGAVEMAMNLIKKKNGIYFR